MINYQKSLKVAQMLGLDKSNAETFTSVVDSALNYVPFIEKKTVLRFGLDLGLVLAESTTSMTN